METMSEVESLREALELVKSRLEDGADIADSGDKVSGGFWRATAKRIDHVLAGGRFHDDTANA